MFVYRNHSLAPDYEAQFQPPRCLFRPIPTLKSFHEALWVDMLNMHTLQFVSASVASFHVRLHLTSRHTAVRVAPVLQHDALHDLLRSLLPCLGILPCLVIATSHATTAEKKS